MQSFEYARVSSIDEAVTLLAEGNGNARALSGGTDLLVALREGRITASVVVDVKGIPELTEMFHDRGGALVSVPPCPVTACTTMKLFRRLSGPYRFGHTHRRRRRSRVVPVLAAISAMPRRLPTRFPHSSPTGHGYHRRAGRTTRSSGGRVLCCAGPHGAGDRASSWSSFGFLRPAQVLAQPISASFRAMRWILP